MNTQKIIIIFGGHYYPKDPGCISHDIIERDWNWKIVDEICNQLWNKKIRVIKGNNRFPLYKKIQLVNRINPVLAIDLHLNCSISKKAQGTEVLYYSKDSLIAELAASELYNELMKELWNNDSKKARGIKTCKMLNRHLGFLKKTISPAIITESLFISNPEEREYLINCNGDKKIIEAHVNGIIKYLNKLK